MACSHKIRYKLPARLRIKKKSDFERVFKNGISVADSRMILYGVKNDCGYSRVAPAAGKRLGNAVKRNRYKRTLREAFRLLQCELPVGYDFVLIPRHTDKPSTKQYGKSLRNLCNKWQRRYQKHQKRK